jgi:hypothetical protein
MGSSRGGWPAGFVVGLPKAPFARVPHRRMLARRGIAKVRFFVIKAAVRAQDRLDQLGARSGHCAREKALARGCGALVGWC